MTNHPVAREMIGYLLVRGGVHAMAYAKALESLTGVEVSKLLAIPKIENARFPEARKFEEMGVHRKLYRFSPDDYRHVQAIWRGEHPQGGALEVVDGAPEGGPPQVLPEEPAVFSTGVHPGELEEIASRLLRSS